MPRVSAARRHPPALSEANGEGAAAPAAVHAALAAEEGELGLFDVRGWGEHARGHPLFAAPLPLSRLELDIDGLTPRRAASLIVFDDGPPDDRAARAAARLRGFGYANVRVMDGGLAGWRAAGYEIFDGVHVPSKAFGEFVEAECSTPRLTADELAALRAAGAKHVVLDSRPLAEYRRMNIPGGICVPGAELARRVRDLAPDPDTLVVVNCAGRTRSIIGAQSLIDAGVPNRVAALENGTMGWTLSGRALETGAARAAPPPSAAAAAWARKAAARVAARFGVRAIGAAELARLRAGAADRTLYLFDVRTQEEYEAGHLPGSRHAPGGQLAQATETWAPVRGARIVLIDDDGARAAMTASWLLRMGWREVAVFALGPGAGPLETGPEPRRVLGLTPARRAFEIDAARLAGMLPGRDMALVDFAPSREYRAGHIPGALWGVRARAARLAARLPGAPMIVAASPDSTLAHLAAPDLGRHARAPVRVLRGGTAAWTAAGFPLEPGGAGILDEEDDIHRLPYDEPPERMEAAMRAYLDWETALIPRVRRDGAARFSLAPAS